MTSNKLAHYLYKYFFLLFAITFGSGFFEELAKGISTAEWKVLPILFFAILFAVFLTFFLLFKDKFKIVELSGQKIRIHDKEKEIEVTWQDIESIQVVSLTNPPIYILRLKNQRKSFLFSSYTTMFGNFHDSSDIGILIEKKRTQFDF